MLRFLISSITIALLLGSITLLGSHQGWWGLPTYWIEILFFILFMTVIVYYNLNNLRARQPEAFIQYYLLSIMLKMVGGLSFISFIIWYDPSAVIGDVTLFIVSYLILTFLEVYFLLGKAAK